MRYWLAGALIVLLVIGIVGYQALTVPSVSSSPVAQAVFSYDIIIRDVVIVDGSGAERQYGSIGILGDKIAAIGPSISGWARRTIDGRGLYAAPGFIDLGPLTKPNGRKLQMGVTTQVVTSADGASLSGMLAGTNLAWLVDQQALTGQIVDSQGSSLSSTQAQALSERLSSSLRSGASGSFIRASSQGAQLLRNDLSLWSAFSEQGASLFWQMPVDDPDTISSVTGLLARAEKYQVPIHLSRVNLSHPTQWGLVYDIINLVDRSGGAVTGDIVPYFEQPPVAERDLTVFVSHPSLAIASGSDDQHPAIAGAFPRLLQRFVSQKPILSIEEAVTKSTLLPAQILGLANRGILRPGYFADLVLFDPSTVHAPSNPHAPDGLPSGISTVLVNGRVAIQDGRETGEAAGRVLQRNQ